MKRWKISIIASPLKLEERGDFMFQASGNRRALVPSAEKNSVWIARREAELSEKRQPEGGFKNRH